MATIYADKSTLPERRDNDFYPTERSLIRAALNAHQVPVSNVQSILDIGAGDGRWGREALRLYPDALVTGVELRNVARPYGFSSWYARQDFLKWSSGNQFDLIVSNPPYGDGKQPSLAERFIRHAWKLLASDGTMMMLLPLDFQTSVHRYKSLWMTHSPVEILVLALRPSFYGRSTAGTNFGVYIWAKGKKEENTGTPLTWKSSLLIYQREFQGSVANNQQVTNNLHWKQASF